MNNEYISNAINELIGSLGVRDDVGYRDFLMLLSAKKTKECIKAIASQLGLPVEINLSLVPKGYKSGVSYYQSRELTPTNSRGRGIGGISAQVSIPSSLPLYGTKALTNFPIVVKISENCYELPKTFVAVMAHELAHVLLYSLLHPQKDNESYTDLTAMILGFSTAMWKGRKVFDSSTHGNVIETNTTTYGYLSDEQFIFARDKINNILRNRKNIKEKFWRQVIEFSRQCLCYKKTLIRFKRFLSYIDSHRKQNIKKCDTRKIVTLHQPGYTDKFEKVINECEKFMADGKKFYQHLVLYTNHALERIKQQKQQMQSLHRMLKSNRSNLKKNIKILRKYVSLWFKIQTAWEMRKYKDDISQQR